MNLFKFLIWNLYLEICPIPAPHPFSMLVCNPLIFTFIYFFLIPGSRIVTQFTGCFWIKLEEFGGNQNCIEPSRHNDAMFALKDQAAGKLLSFGMHFDNLFTDLLFDNIIYYFITIKSSNKLTPHARCNFKSGIQIATAVTISENICWETYSRGGSRISETRHSKAIFVHMKIVLMPPINCALHPNH